MKKDINSQVKFNCIISIIGIILCIACLIYEIINKGSSIIFWILLLSCNILVLIFNLSLRNKND